MEDFPIPLLAFFFAPKWRNMVVMVPGIHMAGYGFGFSYAGWPGGYTNFKEIKFIILSILIFQLLFPHLIIFFIIIALSSEKVSIDLVLGSGFCQVLRAKK